jgi:hypothetical protein
LTIEQKTVNVGDHIFAISDDATKITTALNFMKIGYEKNEAVMLISDLNKDKIRDTISKEWKVDVDTLEANRHIFLKTPDEVIYSQGTFPSKSKTVIWKDLANLSLENEKSGLRIFNDVSAMINAGLENQVLKFESTLDKKFDYPCTIVCSYSPDNIKKMGAHGVQILKDHHNVIWYDKKENLGSEQVEVKRNCKKCGKEFESNTDAIYCSFECAYALDK